jgi:peroxiredoxin
VSRGYWLGLAKDWGLAIGVVVAAFAVWSLFATPRPVSDGPAPDFVLASVAGEEVKLSDFADDEVVVLNFWFTTCGPCRHEIPELTKFHEANPEVPLLGISVDALPLSQLAGRSKKLGITYPVLHDERSRVAADYGVRIFPTTILVRGGEVIMSRIGEVNERSLGKMVAAAKVH